MEYGTEVTGALYVALFAVLGAVIVYATLGISRLLRSERYGVTPAKNAVYECGEDTIGDTQVQFNLNYYLFAMLFVIFDVEAALLYPWATAFDILGWVGVVEVVAFLAILLSGFLYALRKGALKWVY
ncbi:MAG TPA: NADH-quinone oxidoreductase subunit A [Deinococcales bacterium]|nr:NADH-quinone oxidoreductase subunit A [Deinococcales bacterium]